MAAVDGSVSLGQVLSIAVSCFSVLIAARSGRNRNDEATKLTIERFQNLETKVTMMYDDFMNRINDKRNGNDKARPR